MSSRSNRSPEMLEMGIELMPDPAEISTTDYSEDTHNTAPTRSVEAEGIRFAYRRFGNPMGEPIVMLQHFMGNLDNYDPAITDALAMGREVILTDNAGVVDPSSSDDWFSSAPARAAARAWPSSTPPSPRCSARSTAHRI
jgi:pimeloyl-ACP methyl ester carboxylesterase